MDRVILFGDDCSSSYCDVYVCFDLVFDFDVWCCSVIFLFWLICSDGFGLFSLKGCVCFGRELF